ncbi:uncharacterized protein LOC120764378 [Hirundo rustica]|uniref:uncharacterized protein LOC120764378 n=1 Tax=Hirundo rustica TaxID=43150 RepID=UPI00267268D7|nr:uncharacterized protein LOC120764378 [Hirundo rustica]
MHLDADHGFKEVPRDRALCQAATVEDVSSHSSRRRLVRLRAFATAKSAALSASALSQGQNADGFTWWQRAPSRELKRDVICQGEAEQVHPVTTAGGSEHGRGVRGEDVGILRRRCGWIHLVAEGPIPGEGVSPEEELKRDVICQGEAEQVHPVTTAGGSERGRGVRGEDVGRDTSPVGAEPGPPRDDGRGLGARPRRAGRGPEEETPAQWELSQVHPVTTAGGSERGRGVRGEDLRKRYQPGGGRTFPEGEAAFLGTDVDDADGFNPWQSASSWVRGFLCEGVSHCLSWGSVNNDCVTVLFFSLLSGSDGRCQLSRRVNRGCKRSQVCFESFLLFCVPSFFPIPLGGVDKITLFPHGPSLHGIKHGTLLLPGLSALPCHRDLCL